MVDSLAGLDDLMTRVAENLATGGRRRGHHQSFHLILIVRKLDTPIFNAFVQK